MIGKLTGLVDSLDDGWIMIDVAGVGYIVYCSGRTLSSLPRQGEPVSLLIETHVREDHIHLYGFADQAERDWYRLLATVQGVGVKMALAILSTLSPNDLIHAIAAQDKATLTRANGVGQKLANRIVTELKDKVAQLAPGPVVTVAGREAGPGEGGLGKVSEDAISALINLGYRRSEAFGAVAQAARSLGADAPLETIITTGLKELSS